MKEDEEGAEKDGKKRRSGKTHPAQPRAPGRAEGSAATSSENSDTIDLTRNVNP